MRVIEIGNIYVNIPYHCRIILRENLDEFWPKRERKSDALLVLKINGRQLCILIEQTGHPELKDLRRLNEMERKLRDKKLLTSNHIVMKVLHHKGIRNALLVNAARSYKIELQECTRIIDLERILLKRGLTQ